MGIDMVGAAIHGRFVAEGKGGATMRRGANYSTWYNGGLRTTTYFHNMIGILTEAIGNPTPMRVAFVPQRQLPSGDLPLPITPQEWHFRQSIDYSVSGNRAIMDLASRYRDTFLYNIYQMGRNSIQRGSQDSWTITPKRIEAVQAAIAKDRQAQGGEFNPQAARGGFSAGADGKYFTLLREPALRDPRGYVIPSDQADFLTATKFVNALLSSGVAVHRAAVDNNNPLAYGVGTQVDMFFDNSPAFTLRPDASIKGVRPVAWFDGPAPLRSGWAWGQHYLNGTLAVIEATLGKGKVFLYGPEITFRAQPHGTFKFLFNGIYYGPAQAVRIE